MGLSAVEIVVPDTNDGHDDGQVVLELGGAEVVVHARSTTEELLVVLIANNKGNRQSICTLDEAQITWEQNVPDSAPERVTASNPVPELEHVLLSDTKRGNVLGVRGECNKVLRDMLDVLCLREEPRFGSLRVCDGLLSGERLARNDEQRRFGVAHTQRLSHMRSIDVAHKVRLEIPLGVGLQSLSHHHRPKIGATNTDVDDGIDALAGIPSPCATSHIVGKLPNMGENSGNLVRTRLAHILAGEVTQGSMQHGTVLACVDVLASEHRVPGALDTCFAHEGKELAEDTIIHEVLGVIEQECRGGVVLGSILA